MMNRKEFLQKLTALTAGLLVHHGIARTHASGPAEPDDSKSLPKRKFGSTQIVLPVLGLGGYHVGAAANEMQARAIIDTALEEGVCFFDTAQSYQQGGSERWLSVGL